MKYIIILLFSSYTFGQVLTNAPGGRYSHQMNAAFARINSPTAILVNPAGLAKIKSTSVSSGASSLNSVWSKEEESSYTTVTNDSNHIAAIKSLKNFNLGFMLYNTLNISRLDTKYNQSTNSENLQTLSSSSYRLDYTGNSYLFAFAKKDSDFGMALGIFHNVTKTQFNNFAYNHSNTNFSDRFLSTNDSFFEFESYTLRMNLGYQNSFSNGYKLGLNIVLPQYQFKNSGQVTTRFAAQSPSSDTNSIVTTTVFGQNDIDEQQKFLNAGFLGIGLAKNFNGHDFEINITLNPAHTTTTSEYKLRTTAYTWISNTDALQDNSESGNTTENTTSLRATADIYLAHETELNKDLIWGNAIGYIPTTSKDRSGTNTFKFSTGFTQKIQFFEGTYAFQYRKAFDAGNNVSYDSANEEDKIVTLSNETFSFIFTGAYYF